MAQQPTQQQQQQGKRAQQLNLRPQGFSLNINSPMWLGGTNVHNTITIVLLLLLVAKAKAYKL